MKRQELLKVLENKRINDDVFLIVLGSKNQLPPMLPGQFVQIKVESGRAFLRRPFSIHDVDYAENNFSLLIQVVGEGTKAISRIVKGAMVDVIYPLGNSFSVPVDAQKPLLIGGGVGVAPIFFMAKFLTNKGFRPDILLGFRDIKRVIKYEQFIEVGKVFVTTEDGSLGVKGYVTDHPVFNAGTYDISYCCGPEPMMRAVAGICGEKGVKCEVSLENLMGCGIGACLCCVVDTVRGNVCTCTEGPVFNINQLKW
jgi:dihydroorotate dehydrogenase electron transfer subunit